MRPGKKYPQWKTRVWEAVVVFFISFFVATYNNVPVTELIKRPTYFRDILLGMVIIFIVVDFIRVFTTILEQQLPWDERFTTRLISQVLLCLIIPTAFVYLWNFMLFYFFIPDHVFGTPSFLSVEFPVSILLIIFFNLVFIGIIFYQKRIVGLRESVQEVKVELSEQQHKEEATLLLEKGNKKIPVLVKDIAWLYLEDGIIRIVTGDSQKYYNSASLNQLGDLLDPELFFRVNRQNIVNRNYCKQFKTIKYGKIELELGLETVESLVISQKTAPVFRKWMKRSSPGDFIKKGQ